MKKVNVKQGSKVFCKKFLIAGFALAFIIAVSIICAFAAGSGHTQKVAAENPVRHLEQKSGFIRTVNQNEYSFFKQIAEKNTDSKTNLQDVENETKKIINQVNAEFYIANQLELCGPYSFESLQRDMDKENSFRKIKKERSEVFYGPEQFTLISYYDSISSNLKLKIIDKIMQAADQNMVDQAKDYFEKNKTKYNTVKDIHYEIDENGAAKEKVLTQSEMGTLRTADGELFTFLYRGKSGDEKEYAFNGQKRRVKILSVGREEATFESMKNLVMRDYVTLVYYEYLVDLVSRNNPVEFSQNIK